MNVVRDGAGPPSLSGSSYVTGPLFSGLDLLGGILAVAMVLGPLTAAATHASHQGWQTEQAAESQ